MKFDVACFCFESFLFFQLEEKRELLKQCHRFRLTLTDFNFVRAIGQGSFATVYLAKRKQNGQLCCIKVLHAQYMVVQFQCVSFYFSLLFSSPNVFFFCSFSFDALMLGCSDVLMCYVLIIFPPELDFCLHPSGHGKKFNQKQRHAIASEEGAIFHDRCVQVRRQSIENPPPTNHI